MARKRRVKTLEEGQSHYDQRMDIVVRTGAREAGIRGKGDYYAARICSVVLGRDVSIEEARRVCPGVFEYAGIWHDRSIESEDRYKQAVREAIEDKAWAEGYKSWVTGRPTEIPPVVKPTAPRYPGRYPGRYPRPWRYRYPE